MLKKINTVKILAIIFLPTVIIVLAVFIFLYVSLFPVEGALDTKQQSVELVSSKNVYMRK